MTHGAGWKENKSLPIFRAVTVSVGMLDVSG
jgi:hypothetical protein